MADVFTRSQRSELMSRIRSRGNKATELAMVAVFRRCKITGWRRHLPILGKPDFVFKAQKVAVFVDGCFWHSCPEHGRVPKGNRAFWRKKLTANAARDRRVNRELRKSGWRVVRIWEHVLESRPGVAAFRVRAALARGIGA